MRRIVYPSANFGYGQTNFGANMERRNSAGRHWKLR